MFPDDLRHEAKKLLAELRARAMLVATAESCTGGLITALLTEIPGSSEVVDRGFVTYSNDAKCELLDIPMQLITQFGAVSRETAVAMAEGAIANSDANIAVAVTGIAGPGGGSTDKPVGLVHLAVAQIAGPQLHQECRFGDIGRDKVRLETVRAALALMRSALDARAAVKPD